MSKMAGLEQALKQSSGKPGTERAKVKQEPSVAAAPPTAGRPAGRVGKDHIGAWLHSDFSASLRLAQLRKRKDDRGNRIYLDDLIAEALNDLFLKYDVPTVQHE